MNNLLKYGIGLAALGLTIYVAGLAWKRSQDKKNNAAAGFASPGLFNPATVKSEEEKQRIRDMEARGLDEFGRPKFTHDQYGMPRVK
jgi:hypothetical protein